MNPSSVDRLPRPVFQPNWRIARASASNAKHWTQHAAYGFAAALAAALAASARVLPKLPELTAVAPLYLLGIVFVAARFGLVAALLASAAGGVAFDLFLIPPFFGFAVSEASHAVALGALLGSAAIVSVLTDGLRRARERAQRLARERESARLEVEAEKLRNGLLSSVSHDLKTPLASILASSQLLARSHAEMSSSLRGDVLAGIVAQAERLDALLRNLLAMTRLEAGRVALELTPGELEQVVASALRQTRTLLGERQVSFEVAGDLPLVPMDALLLEQVFTNLLENAAKFSPVTSRVRISASAAGGRAFVEIEDDGPGIPDAELERVFDKFYRAPSAARVSGAGLGLAICRAAIRAHGGEIAFEAGRMRGALVRVSLPVAHVELAEAQRRLPELT